jgi:hypothetical protein
MALKTSLLVPIVLLSAIDTAAYAVCAVSPLAGSWLNADPASRSIKRVDYVQFCNDTVGIPCDENGCYPPPPPPAGEIRLFGSCSPTNCDWGFTNVANSAPWVRGNYDQGFAQREVLARHVAATGRLELITRTRFVDGSGRPNREDREFFRRANVAVSREANVDRPGRDYLNYATTSDANACRSNCQSDVKCTAFTWVPPGVQGPQARCWLKNAVPGAVSRTGMVSGVKTIN